MPIPGDPLSPLPEHSADPSKMTDDQLAHSIVHIEEDIDENEDDIDWWGPWNDLLDRNGSLWHRLDNLLSELLKRPGGCITAVILVLCGFLLSYAWGYGWDSVYDWYPGLGWYAIGNGLDWLGGPSWVIPFGAAAGLAGGYGASRLIGGGDGPSHDRSILGALGEGGPGDGGKPEEKPKENEDTKPEDEGTDTGTDTREPEPPAEPDKGGEKPDDVVPIVGDSSGPQPPEVM